VGNVIFFDANSFFGTELELSISNRDKMVTGKKPEKPEKPGEEKEWENPFAPENTSDERDREQLARQYKEAKRRHDNLSENQEDKEEEEDKN
jgi:hypothetical protein